MNTHMTIAIVIFAVTLLLIMTEKINRVVAALTGAVLMLLFKVMTEKEAIGFIDFNTIGILVGMMIIVSIVKTTGLFEYVAIWAAKKVKANPWSIILIFSILTAVTSALLDNVTTVLLMAPMTLVITGVLEVDPIPFLIPEIIASNIGGTATLIGDPPNIMIGSAFDLGFLDFIMNLTPIIIIIFTVVFLVLKLIYAKKLVVSEEKKQEIMSLDENKMLENIPLVKKSIGVLILVTLGFFMHEHFGYPSSVIALAGATLLILISKTNVEEVFETVEWPTIFFFISLFVLVGGLEEVGVVDNMAEFLLGITNGNILLTGISVIWMSAIISTFLDNIPFVATLIPLIKVMGHAGTMDVTPLYWAMSLGACLGGNGSLIGASANVIVAGIAEKNGHKLGFGTFFKIGFPMMLISVAIATVYLVIFYLL